MRRGPFHFLRRHNELGGEPTQKRNKKKEKKTTQTYEGGKWSQGGKLGQRHNSSGEFLTAHSGRGEPKSDQTLVTRLQKVV